MNLFWGNLTKEEVLKRVGDISQVCGIEASTLNEGVEKGIDIVRFRSGTGFNFTVLPDRGMDIGEAEYRGCPLAWRSATGYVNSCYFEPQGFNWLRSFHGGLLTTCGLTYLGEPCEDGGEQLGLHGRVSNLPAKNVSIEQHWQNDEYMMCLKGKVREARVFGENVCLTREIKVKSGESRILVKDEVENLGFRETEHMILYHINIGFPVIDEGTKLVAPSTDIVSHDKEAEMDKGEYNLFSGPVHEYREKVYYHKMKPDAEGNVRVELINEKLGSKFYVIYSMENLPNFAEWKMMGEGEYVLGLEPSNCHVKGRKKEREQGTLQFLAPHEKREYHLELGLEEL